MIYGQIIVEGNVDVALCQGQMILILMKLFGVFFTKFCILRGKLNYLEITPKHYILEKTKNQKWCKTSMYFIVKKTLQTLGKFAYIKTFA